MVKKYESFIIFFIIGFIVCGVTVLNYFFPNDYTYYTSAYIYYDKATVVEVNSENLMNSPDFAGWTLGAQEVLVQFTSGMQKGEFQVVKNFKSTTHNIEVDVGTKVIVKAERPDNVAPYYTIYSYNRSSGIVVTVALFVLAMAFVAKLKGIKSVIGLAVSMYCIIAFLIPAIYRGWSPIVTTIVTVLAISVVSLLLLNGFCEKTYTAIASTMLGVLISSFIFLFLQKLMVLSGYNLSEAESLIVISRFTGLKINEIFFSAVLISSLGAVIDTAMSIAASIYEIRDVHPTMDKAQLYNSGVSIGRDMIGTMCQTLILAFVGSTIATLLVFVSYGTQFNQFFHSNYIALELVQAVSGSMAIIFTVPITAYLSTLTHGKDGRS